MQHPDTNNKKIKMYLPFTSKVKLNICCRHKRFSRIFSLQNFQGKKRKNGELFLRILDSTESTLYKI